MNGQLYRFSKPGQKMVEKRTQASQQGDKNVPKENILWVVVFTL